jgi:hypothetical protein
MSIIDVGGLGVMCCVIFFMRLLAFIRKVVLVDLQHALIRRTLK